MTAIINGLTAPSSIEVAFSWTPFLTYTFTAPNGTVLTPPRALSNTLLTFTATTQFDNDPSNLLSIVEYRWDFGDGIRSYGNPTTHTYTIQNLQAFTVLRVLDNQGRYWFSRQQMYLG